MLSQTPHAAQTVRRLSIYTDVNDTSLHAGVRYPLWPLHSRVSHTDKSPELSEGKGVNLLLYIEPPLKKFYYYRGIEFMFVKAENNSSESANILPAGI